MSVLKRSIRSCWRPDRLAQGRAVRQTTGRHGSILIEFAIVALALYLIIAAVFTFGQVLYDAESLQHTADTFAHELARTPLPPNDTLTDALQDPTVTSTLFDEQYLDIDITTWVNGAAAPIGPNLDQYPSLDQYLQSINVPMINRMLAPLMIIDQRPPPPPAPPAPPQPGPTHLWYPGATLDPNTGHYYINILNPDNPTVPTTHPVIEAVSTPDTFPLGSAPIAGITAPPSGLAGIRINLAYQSAALSAYTYSVNGAAVPSPVGQDNVLNTPIVLPPDEPTDFSPTRGGLYGGPDHLGQQYAGVDIVRPFQRLISAQAVYRREVFGPEPTTGP